MLAILMILVIFGIALLAALWPYIRDVDAPHNNPQWPFPPDKP